MSVWAETTIKEDEPQQTAYNRVFKSIDEQIEQRIEAYMAEVKEAAEGS